MSNIKKNVFANYIGSFWQAVMGLLFVPLYIKFMGVEAYGLIGIFATLQALFVLLDMGLTPTLTREMARLSALRGREQEMRDLVRSLEVIYWGVALCIFLVVSVMAPFAANHWIQPGQLSPLVVENAIRMMGFAMAIQWPVSFYSGGLIGLEKLVLLNSFNAGISTLRGGGAVFVLWAISPTIYAFFLWQIIVSVLNTVSVAWLLWKQLGPWKSAGFQKQLVFGVWKFAAGLSGITVMALILTQSDKIILSRMLSLEAFGYYALASSVAMNIYRLAYPLNTGVYPKLIKLVSINDQQGLAMFYHKSCQVMSVLVLPAAIVVALFSREILFIWTQNLLVASHGGILLSILVLGTAFNGLMVIPYSLQLAHGWTKFAFYVNLISVILLLPLIIFLTKKYGAVGGASVWLILNIGYILIPIQVMHTRLLKNEKMSWYVDDIGRPLVASLVTAVIGRMCVSGNMSQFFSVVYIGFISCLTLLAAILATENTRKWVFSVLSFKEEPLRVV